MKKLLTLCVAISLAAAPSPAAGQAGSAGSNVGQTRNLQVSDRFEAIRKHFEQAATVTRMHVANSGWGKMADDSARQQDHRFLVEDIRGSLNRFGRKPSVEDVPSDLGRRLQRYFADLDDIYGLPERSLPPTINEAKDSITLPLLDQLARLNAQYYRRFFVKYGKTSERLNLLEIFVLNELFSADPTKGPERQINPFEPILRVQTIGYQLDTDRWSAVPSSPTFQVGGSFYLFQDNRFARFVNHVGVAAAYQHDLVDGRDLWGGVAHIRNLDVGLLCTSPCKKPVILASTNIQIVRNWF